MAGAGSFGIWTNKAIQRGTSEISEAALRTAKRVERVLNQFVDGAATEAIDPILKSKMAADGITSLSRGNRAMAREAASRRMNDSLLQAVEGRRSTELQAIADAMSQSEAQIRGIGREKEGILNAIPNKINNIRRGRAGDAYNRAAESYSELNDRFARETAQQEVIDNLIDTARAENMAFDNRRRPIDYMPISRASRQAYRSGGIEGLAASYMTDTGSVRWGSVARDAGGMIGATAVGMNALGDAGSILSGNRTLTYDEAGRRDIAFIPLV